MISIKSNNNDTELVNKIDSNLHKFNRTKCEWLRTNTRDSDNIINSGKENNNFFVFDDNVLIGGAVGFIEFGWYFLDLLWVDEKYRGQDIGTKLIKEIEKFSVQENLTGVRMETWDFQARGFYEKMGYTVFAQIEDCPPGTTDYFLKKVLK